jgi:hypothetical protein
MLVEGELYARKGRITDDRESKPFEKPYFNE